MSECALICFLRKGDLMKKILLVVILIATLSLASCSLGGIGNALGGLGGSGGGGSQETDGGNEYDPTKQLIWNISTDVYLITPDGVSWRSDFSDKIASLRGANLIGHSDTKAKQAHEIVIGPSTRPISQKAYNVLERNMTEDDDPEGYVIYVQDGSVAVAYSSDAALSGAIEAFYAYCGMQNFYADNGAIHWDFYSLRARAEYTRDEMYAEEFAKAEAALLAKGVTNAAEIVKEIKTYYGLFKTDQLYWLADLYDPELGAFYYSNTGRDNLGFLPDLESTGQAFMMLDRSGLFDVIGGLSNGGMPEVVVEPMTNWLRSLQDPLTGFFFHPQWGESIGNSRRSRDLDNAVSLFKFLKTQPYYNEPSNRLKGILGAPGENAVKPASSLTGRLGTSAVTAVSMIQPAASASTLPYYLQSMDAWKAYIEKLNIPNNSYAAGNSLASDWALIKAADEKAGGTEYVDYIINYLNETQHPDIGLWEYQNEADYDPDDKVGYNGTNGLMKICVFYGSVGRAVPNAYNALKSAIKVGLYPNTDPKDETVCYTLNIWTCIGSMLNNIKAHDPDNYQAALDLLYENAPALLKSSYDLQHTHLMEDGGFSYFERRSINVSQGAPVACAQGRESDINSTMVVTSSTVNAMLGSLGLDHIPIWCEDDYYIYVRELENAQQVYKHEAPKVELIDFNDYVENELYEGSEKMPHENVNISLNTQYYSSTVVTRPGSSDVGDLALRVESLVETEPDANGTHQPLKDENGNYIMATGPANSYFMMGNTYGNGNCYSFEADILVEESDIGTILELWFGEKNKSANTAGIYFITYKRGDEKYIRVADLQAGLDGTRATNHYENLKVGEWFKLRVELYKIYKVDEEAETQTLEVLMKIFINDQYIITSDSAITSNGVVTDVDIGRAFLSHYRYRASTIYVDNVLCAKEDKEYVREWEPEDPTLPDIEIEEGVDHNYVATFEGDMVNDAFMFNYPGGVNAGKPGFDHTMYDHITAFSLASDVDGRAGQVLKVVQKNNSVNFGSSSFLRISNTAPKGNTYTLEMAVNYAEMEKSGTVTQLYFNGKDANGENITALMFGLIYNASSETVAIVPNNTGAGGTGNNGGAGLPNISIPAKQWVTLRIEFYMTGDKETTRVKFYNDADGEMKFVGDFRLFYSEAAAVGIDGVLPTIEEVRIFHQRTNEATIYFDDMSFTRTEGEYVRETLQNQVNFDDGTILCKPSISVNTGSADTAIAKGDTEGGNSKNYFKIRDDVEGKVGDAVLEVTHAANQKDSEVGKSDIGIGITDGSSEGNIYVFEFDMMVELDEVYNSVTSFFTRVRIGSSGNAGLFQQLSSDGTNIICMLNGSPKNAVKLGTFGEWFHVKMVYNVLNPSTVDKSQSTYEFYLYTYIDGVEELAHYSTGNTSYVATNKDMSHVYLTGVEDSTTFERKYFVDNLTYVRTADESIIPEVEFD